VQPLFRCDGHAAFLGDGNEVAKVPKFHSAYLVGMPPARKVFLPPLLPTYLCLVFNAEKHR
jgi:hypothetical protein